MAWIWAALNTTIPITAVVGPKGGAAWVAGLGTVALDTAYQSALKAGSHAQLVVLGQYVADHAGLQQIELPAPIHLAFDKLELGDLPLSLTVQSRWPRAR